MKVELSVYPFRILYVAEKLASKEAFKVFVVDYLGNAIADKAFFAQALDLGINAVFGGILIVAVL